MHDRARAGEALALINKAIEVNGSDLSLADTRAVVLIRAGQSGRALQQLQPLRQHDPQNGSTAFHMAWAYLKNGDTNSARAMFRQAEQLGVSPRLMDPLELLVFEDLRKQLTAVP